MSDQVPDLGPSDSRAFALLQEGASLLEDYSENKNVEALKRAEERLREAVADSRAYPSALFLHAMALEYLGDHTGAVSEFSLLRDLHPGYQRDEVLFNLATSYLTSYNEMGYQNAVQIFEQLTTPDRDPAVRALAHASIATTYAHRLISLTGRGDVGEFRAVFEATEEQRRRAVEVRAMVRDENWKTREADWLAENARGVAHMYRGRDALRRQDNIEAASREYDEAERAFVSALRLSPGNLDVLANQGTLLLYRWQISSDDRSDLLNAARAMYQRVIAARPDIDFGYYRLGQIERRLGLFAEARAALEKALNVPFREAPRHKIVEELERATDFDNRDTERLAS